MAISYKLYIDSTALLDPNAFDVSESATSYDTLTNMQKDDIILERKGTNYVKATIRITWRGIPDSYVNTIATLLSASQLHTVARGSASWGSLKLDDFSRTLRDDLRSEAKKDVFYYDVSCTLSQHTSGLLTY